MCTMVESRQMQRCTTRGDSRTGSHHAGAIGPLPIMPGPIMPPMSVRVTSTSSRSAPVSRTRLGAHRSDRGRSLRADDDRRTAQRADRPRRGCARRRTGCTRAYRGQVTETDLAGWAEYGYCASHSRFFWGLRLHLVCTLSGLPVAFALAGAKADEREVLLGMLDADPNLVAVRPHQKLMADKKLLRQGIRRSTGRRRSRAAAGLRARARNHGRATGPSNRFGRSSNRSITRSIPNSTSNATAAGAAA